MTLHEFITVGYIRGVTVNDLLYFGSAFLP